VSQPGVAYDRAPWQVRIRRQRDAPPMGGGMFCRDGHVVTCAHVVSENDEPPDGPVYVEFQHADAHEPIPAVVIDGGWFPSSTDEGILRGDIAILRLEAPAPAQAAHAPLCSSPEGVASPHSFHTYGYPKGHPRGGVPARGTIVGAAGSEWLSLEVKAVGQGLDPGFSGSPVWDVELGGVVGIVTRRDAPYSSGDRGGGRIDPRTAYAIRMEVLARYWPPLEPMIVSGPTGDSQRLDALLEIRPVAGELPVVAEASVYELGVTRSKYVSAKNPDPPYVQRARLDTEIQTRLDAGERFIVAVGDSKSGKSRSMAEALRRLRPRARLIVPIGDPAALPKLARLPLALGDEGGILWLDDIDRYLVPQGLDHGVLSSFLGREPPVTIVGTVTSKRYHGIVTARDTGTRIGQVLSQAQVVHVASRLNQEDRAAAEQAYPEEDFRERGIGEQLVAAPLVEQRYDTAREVRPEGWAVVQAAVDWRRIGVPSPVSRSTLRSLFPAYLAEVARHLDPTDELFDIGITWARDPLAGTIALLTTVELAGDQTTYRAFDYVLACADGHGPVEPVPVARAAWDKAIASLGADELLAVTHAALTRAEIDIAKLTAAAARGRSRDPAAKAMAALVLGEMYANGAQADSAIELLEEAAGSGVPDVVSIAQVDLGALLSTEGRDPVRGRALLESAIAADDPLVTAEAQLNLGVLLMNAGDLNTARPLLEAALAAQTDFSMSFADDTFVGLSRQGTIERAKMSRKETPDVGRPAKAEVEAPSAGGDWSRKLRAATLQGRAESVHLLAQANLGGLLVTEGDLSRARVLLDAALSSNNPSVVPLARTNFGALLARHGEVQAAREQFEQALQSGNPGVTPLAQIGLGCLLVANDDFEHGSELLAKVAASDNADHAPRALCLLGGLLIERGELEAARSYLQRAARTGHRDWTPYATVGLGLITAYEGDVDGAREQLEAVIAAHHPEQSAHAADRLGDILLNAGDLSGAEASYRQAIASQHPSWANVARIDLAGVRAQQGALDEAEELLRSVADGSDQNASPWAACLLGDLLRFRVGDPRRARAEYQRAIDAGHPDWSVVGRFSLAQLLAAEQEPAAAAAQLREIADNCPNRTYVAKALDWLGDLLASTDDVTGARTAYQEAIDAGVRDWSAIAQVDLALLVLDKYEDIDQAESLLTSALASGVPDVVASTRYLLGLIAVHRGDRARARTELQLAADEGSPQVVGHALIQIAKISMDDGELTEAAAILEHLLDGSFGDEALEQYAAAHLGALRLRQGDTDAAMPLLQRGTASDDPDTMAYSCVNLGTYLFDLGDIDAAAEYLSAAVDTGNSEVADLAQAALGMVRLAQGRLDQAHDLLQAALASGNTAEEPKVRRFLGSVLARQGRRAEARAVLGPLAASSDTEHRPAGLLLLGRLAVQDGDNEGGRQWLTAAVATENPEVESDARYELGFLLAQLGDVAGSRQILTPLLDGQAIDRDRAEAVLTELTAAEHLAPASLPPDRPAAALPAPAAAGTAPGLEGRTGAGPGTSPGPAVAEQAPLPSSMLSLLADLADVEGNPAEAEYWRGVLASARATT
jgi:tetratricopeptide (TPR) repeat protein